METIPRFIRTFIAVADYSLDFSVSLTRLDLKTFFERSGISEAILFEWFVGPASSLSEKWRNLIIKTNISLMKVNEINLL